MTKRVVKSQSEQIISKGRSTELSGTNRQNKREMALGSGSMTVTSEGEI